MIFLLLGPPIGALLVALILFSESGSIATLIESFALFAPLSYIFGGVPALCAGFAHNNIISRSRDRDIGVYIFAAITAAFTGGLVAAVVFLVIFQDTVGGTSIIAGVGSALICSGISSFVAHNSRTLNCPACNIEISRDIQNSMSPLFGGPVPTNCSNCGQEIQWSAELHPKIILCGTIFKTGLALTIVSLFATFVNISSLSRYGVVLGVVIAIVGALLAPTNSRSGRIEKSA